MQLYDATDYTGDGAAHTLASILGISKATWFQVTPISIASTAARVGSASVSASQGALVSASLGQFAPPVAQAYNPYDLAAIYLLVQTGDQVQISAAL